MKRGAKKKNGEQERERRKKEEGEKKKIGREAERGGWVLERNN